MILVTSVLLITGCKKEVDTITFNATIEEVNDNNILVKTSDAVGFDLASVGYDKDLKIDFNLIVGQEVTITILPEIRESYPVQVTAVKIKLVTK